MFPNHTCLMAEIKNRENQRMEDLLRREAELASMIETCAGLRVRENLVRIFDQERSYNFRKNTFLKLFTTFSDWICNEAPHASHDESNSFWDDLDESERLARKDFISEQELTASRLAFERSLNFRLPKMRCLVCVFLRRFFNSKKEPKDE